MSKCNVNENGQHSFYTTIAANVNQSNISTFHTCIACGELRAITRAGNLIVFNTKTDDWEFVKT